MPRFAANLAYLFTELPLLERFAAAAAVGFDAVELQAPYDHPPGDIRREIERHGLTILGINTPAAPGAETGLAAVPGREQDFAALFARALPRRSGGGPFTASPARCRRTGGVRPRMSSPPISGAPPTSPAKRESAS